MHYLLVRYYQAMAWFGWIGRRTVAKDPYALWATAEDVAQGLQQDRSDHYAYWARSCLLLFCGTGRLDLIEDVEPAEISDRFEVWQRWMKFYGDTDALTFNTSTWTWTLGRVQQDEAVRNAKLVAPFADWGDDLPDINGSAAESFVDAQWWKMMSKQWHAEGVPAGQGDDKAPNNRPEP